MIGRGTLVRRSLAHHVRIHLSVAAGVAAATAVLTGALIVGDSMRGSLRAVTLERLGAIDEVLVSDRFFQADRATALADAPEFSQHFSAAEPAILIPSGVAEKLNESGFAASRSSGITILGVPAGFWEWSEASPARVPEAGQVILNRPLAQDLQADVGDRVTLRLPSADNLPADSTLAQKEGRLASLARLEVIEIIPAAGLGRFSLHPNQALPRNAYVALGTAQQGLDADGEANTILVAGDGSPPTPAAHDWLSNRLTFDSADVGLQLDRSTLSFEDETVFDYWSISSERLLLENPVADAVRQATTRWNGQPVITYLVDALRPVEASGASAANEAAPGEDLPEVPYSMVSGIDNSPLFPYLPAGEQLADDEVAINQFVADRLGIGVGDTVRLEFFEPETSHATPELLSAEFRVRAVLPITQPSRPYLRRRDREFSNMPTRFNDTGLTPTVEGITDQASIDLWEAPFPYDSNRMLDPDNDYWDYHRTTPKAFVSFERGSQLWGSRFGQVTSVILAAAAVDEPTLRDALDEQLAADRVTESLGILFRPVKYEGLQASQGTTPFDGLFLGLSFFIILAAVLLISLLFRLGVEQRYPEIGLLAAVGFRRPQIARLLIIEGAVVAAAGGIAGVAMGMLYGWVMITGLNTWWSGAIASGGDAGFLEMYTRPLTLLGGYLSGVLLSAGVIYLSLRAIRRNSTRGLLAGRTDNVRGAAPNQGRLLNIVAGVTLVAAVGLVIAATNLAGEAQAGAFVGGGAMLLTAFTLFTWNRLRRPQGVPDRLSLLGLATSNARRFSTRSALTIGLVAAASFLIVAMSAFRMAPTESGTGGFAFVGRTASPIFADLQDTESRLRLLGNEQALVGADLYGFRVQAGDDASCRNLFQSTRPQVYGVPDSFVDRFDESESPKFGWAGAATDDLPEEQRDNPWRLLQQPLEGDVIPVVVDKNTAMYSLHWYGGVGAEYTLTYEQETLRFRVVGLLANSVLQGALLVGDENFRATFPDVSGFQYFLVDAAQDADAIRSELEARLGDQGFDAVSATQVLADLLAVQNTYLSAFQSLGGLGLLLGVFGLAAVQLRSVIERRGELALLRAAGYSRARVGRLVLTENLELLLLGLGNGTLAALAAVLPHVVFSGSRPPWLMLGFWLAAILLAGLGSAAFAMRRTLRAPLIGALRGD